MKYETVENLKKEFIFCFPPRERMAGNFFTSMLKTICWKPEIKASYSFYKEGQKECLFLNKAPILSKWDAPAKLWIQYRLHHHIKQYEKKEGIAQGQQEVYSVLYEMKNNQDYPAILCFHFAEEFMEQIHYGKRIHIGFVEGNALGRREMIQLIRQYYDRVNYLTVFSKEPEAYEELVSDAWNQYGLTIVITRRLESLRFCDYILDCTVLPFEGKWECRKGCFFYSLYCDKDKIRSLRKMGQSVRFDSCTSSLDRAFHNKV